MVEQGFLQMNPLLQGGMNKYIWISDIYDEYESAQRLFDYLMKKNIYINGFATNTKSMFHLKMYNKEIYDVNMLDTACSVVIYDPYFGCAEIAISHMEYSARIIHPDIEQESDEVYKDVIFNAGMIKKKLFSLEAFWMFNHFCGKKIYIYGMGEVEREFVKYLKLLDYNVAGFLIDGNDVEEINGEYPVKYVEEILFEEDFFVWTYEKKAAKKLNELGLKYFKDYYVKDYRFDVTVNQKTILDINLGNNYLSDSKYPGMLVYGDDKENDYKIVTLGGSTTDGTMYPFKSWSQFLYEELGEDITVYNGGVCSYTSGQELIKMCRDVLQLKPDMVIVYDGYNDLAFNVYSQYPFSFLYLEKVFDYAQSHLEDDEDSIYTNEKEALVCRGIESKQNRFGNWCSNIRTMYAVAKENNISFFSFCQPVLYSKKGKTIREKNILLSVPGSAISLFMKESFREYMNQMQDKPAYMFDLSHIFDKEDNVYMDVCHVWEDGNRIIAREIKKRIQSELAEKRKNLKTIKAGKENG